MRTHPRFRDSMTTHSLGPALDLGPATVADTDCDCPRYIYPESLPCVRTQLAPFQCKPCTVRFRCKIKTILIPVLIAGPETGPPSPRIVQYAPARPQVILTPVLCVQEPAFVHRHIVVQSSYTISHDHLNLKSIAS